MRKIVSIPIFILFAAVIPGSVFAGSVYMHHSGRITGSDNMPVTGVVATTFSVYSQLEGGTAEWFETFDVAYEDGYYSVVIGQETSLDSAIFEEWADDQTLYLGIAFGSDEFGPRFEITSVPFTFMAGAASQIINSDGLVVSGTQIINDSGDWLGNDTGMDPDSLETYLIDNNYTTESTLGTHLSDNDFIALDALETYLDDNNYVTGAVVMQPTVYSSESELPAAGDNAGGLVYVQDVSQIFYSNGSSWTNMSGQSSIWSVCRGQDVDGVCVTDYKYNSTGFYNSSNWCAARNSDICSDSQMTILLRERVMRQASWTNSYADNDAGSWNVANGGTGDNHGQSTAYGVACCSNSVPPNAVASQNIGGIRVTHIANEEKYYWEQAAGVCAALRSDLCSKSQYSVIRSNGGVSVRVWASDHSDNDGGEWTSIVGGVSDNTTPDQVYGFACCAGTRPVDGSCPGTDVNGICMAKVVNSGVNFATASADCASEGVDICSMSESYTLRQAGTITHADNWTDSGSDIDGNSIPNAIGSAGHNNTSINSSWGYACCY